MKSKISTTIFIIFIGALATVTPGFSQGTRITYQGRLNDGVNLASGSYDLRFIAYDNGIGGSQQGPVLTNSATAVSNGLFTATLDFGNVFPGADRFLEIAVRTNGSGGFATLSPRQPLTPAPYAIMANSASNLLGVLPAVQLSGTLQNSSLPSNPSFSGTVSAISFSGIGSGLTALNATQLTSGTVPSGRLSGSYGIDITGDASTLGGLTSSGFWRTSGNAGTAPGANFLGTTDNQPLELRVNGQRALRLEPNTNGAANVIGGSSINFVAPGTVGAVIAGGGATNYFGSSYSNSVAGDFSSIGGGRQNTIQNGTRDSTIGGGEQNTIQVSSGISTIGGGNLNTIEGTASVATISGGKLNTIQTSAFSSTIGGGQNNTIETNAVGSTISGGGGNTVQDSADNSTIGGGSGNTIQTGAAVSAIGGGVFNTTTGNYATVPGGDRNVAGANAFAAGHRAKANNTGDFVWADSTDADFAAAAPNQFLIRASGGVGIGTASPQVFLHILAGQATTRFQSTASANGSVIELWNDTVSSGYLGAINFINGTGPTFEGQIAYLTGAGINFTAGGTERMRITAGGNVGIGTNAPVSRFQVVNARCDGSSWINASDRNLKQDFASIDTRSVLDRVAALPVRLWSYKANPGAKHLGPVAQDFKAAFGLGADDTSIATVDADGVALAAIQGLNQKLNEKDAEIQQLRQRLDALENIIHLQKFN